MNTKRVYWIMLGTVFLLGGILIASFVYGNRILTKASSDLVKTKLESNILTEQQNTLISAKKELEEFAELEQLARAIVPQDKDQARAVRELVAIASSVGVNLKVITFSGSNLGQAVPKASSPSATETPAPATAAVNSPLTQVKPVDGIPGLYSLEINVQSDEAAPISYAAFLRFLERLEQNRRTAQVTNIGIKPLPTNPDQLTFTLTINLFIKPAGTNK